MTPDYEKERLGSLADQDQMWCELDLWYQENPEWVDGLVDILDSEDPIESGDIEAVDLEMIYELALHCLVELAHRNAAREE